LSLQGFQGFFQSGGPVIGRNNYRDIHIVDWFSNYPLELLVRPRQIGRSNLTRPPMADRRRVSRWIIVRCNRRSRRAFLRPAVGRASEGYVYVDGV
jgi:hypothetical protein